MQGLSQSKTLENFRKFKGKLSSYVSCLRQISLFSLRISSLCFEVNSFYSSSKTKILHDDFIILYSLLFFAYNTKHTFNFFSSFAVSHKDLDTMIIFPSISISVAKLLFSHGLVSKISPRTYNEAFLRK